MQITGYMTRDEVRAELNLFKEEVSTKSNDETPLKPSETSQHPVLQEEDLEMVAQAVADMKAKCGTEFAA